MTTRLTSITVMFILNSNMTPNLEQSSSTGPIAAGSPKGKTGIIVSLIIGIIVATATGFGGYTYGKRQAKPVSTATDTALTLPQGATLVAQCVPGRGAQYALAKDIPAGPVYNVYKGQVIGLEFMIGDSKVMHNTLTGTPMDMNMDDLGISLSNAKYDHFSMNVFPNGHAGFTEQHYMFDVYNVPKTVTDAITC